VCDQADVGHHAGAHGPVAADLHLGEKEGLPSAGELPEHQLVPDARTDWRDRPTRDPFIPRTDCAYRLRVRTARTELPDPERRAAEPSAGLASFPHAAWPPGASQAANPRRQDRLARSAPGPVGLGANILPPFAKGGLNRTFVLWYHMGDS